LASERNWASEHRSVGREQMGYRIIYLLVMKIFWSRKGICQVPCGHKRILLSQTRVQIKFAFAQIKAECWKFWTSYRLYKISLFFDTGSPYVFQTGLELVIYPRLVSNLWSSCLSLSSAGITGLCYHTQLQNLLI
jgi:hypothetical protein